MVSAWFTLKPGFLLVAFLMPALLLTQSGCAENECNFNSQCGPSRYCLAGACFQSCELDLDCPAGLVCSPIGQCEPGTDGGRDAAADIGGDSSDDVTDVGPRLDIGGDVATDAPTTDVGPDGRTDAGEDVVMDVPVDAGPRKARLDPCLAPAECASDLCSDGRCTISCTGHGDCADDEFCRSGVCSRDDTGTMCTTASPATCGLGLCVGVATSADACTRPCANAGDCPAGFACSVIGGQAVCVEIEVPCTDCGTGFCFPGTGCTATCRSSADCPARATALGVAAYTCAVPAGSTNRVCVPPTDIRGADPIGTSCPPTGFNSCRSGLCNTDSPLGPMCTQTCDAEGGCPPGFGCKPEEDAGGILFLCARAGSRQMGEACTRARECETALCNAPGYCTRLCEDRLCPTGYRCDPIPTTGSSLCTRL